MSPFCVLVIWHVATYILYYYINLALIYSLFCLFLDIWQSLQETLVYMILPKSTIDNSWSFIWKKTFVKWDSISYSSLFFSTCKLFHFYSKFEITVSCLTCSVAMFKIFFHDNGIQRMMVLCSVTSLYVHLLHVRLLFNIHYICTVFRFEQ